MRLIDADALKEAIENHFDMLDAYFPNKFIEEIDNAPTVELTELCKGCQYLKDCETCDKNERHKGETSVCQNPKGNCFTCKLFEVCNAKTKPADMRGENNG